jgi:hypothetical protein
VPDAAWATLDLTAPPPELTAWLAGAAPPAGPGTTWHVVIENHPGCPTREPHGVVTGDGHLLACHATPQEARAIAEKLDLSGPSDLGDSSTGAPAAAVAHVFDPAKHPRIEHGHGGGQFTHDGGGIAGPKPGTGGHLHDGITDPPASEALKMKGAFTLADRQPGDKLLGKIDAKLTHPQMGAGPNKGKIRRPPVPPYRQSVAKTSAAMMALIEQQGTLEEGKKWYPDEHEMNHRRALAYHVPIDRAIGVEAATCPRVQWLVNQRVTNEMLDEVPKAGLTIEKMKIAHHLGGGVMASFRNDGADIILNGNVDQVLGGTKRRNFYNNIMWPGQTDSITVDTWMLQALKPLGLNDQQAMSLGQQYAAGLADGLGKIIVADAIRDATAKYQAQGVDITPDGVQAAAWIAIQKQLGLSDPSAHTNPRDVGYMHAAAAIPVPDPDDEGAGLSDDQWDAQLLLEYLEWLSEAVPGGVDLGSPGSARLTGGLAADNPAAWTIATNDPRFGRLGMTTAQAKQAARGDAPQAAAKPAKTGPITVRENHPQCPPGNPHGTVDSRTGEVVMCHRTKAQAQDLALTLNYSDADMSGAPGGVQVGAGFDPSEARGPAGQWIFTGTPGSGEHAKALRGLAGHVDKVHEGTGAGGEIRSAAAAMEHGDKAATAAHLDSAYRKIQADPQYHRGVAHDAFHQAAAANLNALGQHRRKLNGWEPRGAQAAAHDFVPGEHPRGHGGKFVRKGEGVGSRPRAPGQGQRQPGVAGPPGRSPGQRRPAAPRRTGSTRPAGPAEGMTVAQTQVAVADIAKMIDQQVAKVTDRLTADQHEQLRQVKAELERSQAELAKFHKEEITDEQKATEKKKTIRKLIHHVLALAAVAVLTFIGVKTGTLDNPLLAGLSATGPLFIQEALDAVKKV